MAAAIAAALAAADPTDASSYRHNAHVFTEQVQHLIDREHAARPAIAGDAVAITEPVAI